MNYSTMRNLTDRAPEDLPVLPKHMRRQGEGGLRLRGNYKKSLPNNPLISVITVVVNGEQFLEETILSVLNQTYDNVEYIIVDGGSTDGTLDIINKYESSIDYWVSEPDVSVYEAMNKGIILATGEWLNFMNGGDLFADQTVLNFLSEKISTYDDVAVFYSDTIRIHGRKKRIGKNDHRRLTLNHQSMIYKKSLHSTYGSYVVGRGVTISDYIFFCSIQYEPFRKVDIPIAIYETTGMSGDGNTYYKKSSVDFIFGRVSWSRLILGFLIYRPYRKLKEIFIECY